MSVVSGIVTKPQLGLKTRRSRKKGRQRALIGDNSSAVIKHFADDKRKEELKLNGRSSAYLQVYRIMITFEAKALSYIYAVLVGRTEFWSGDRHLLRSSSVRKRSNSENGWKVK